MHRAFELAQRAGCAGEVPVGALVVRDHEIIGEGFYEYFGAQHAEIKAIKSIKEKFQNLKNLKRQVKS